MTHDSTKAAALRATCNRVGTTRLALAIGVHPSLLRKKAAGTVGISQRDQVAIEQALRGMADELVADS